MTQEKLHTAIPALGYRLLTGKSLSENSARISLSFAGFALKLALAKALVMFANLFIGRYLGAGPFGHLALILAIGNFWCLPFFTCWGLAYVRFVSEGDPEKAPQQYLPATLTCVLLAICLELPFLLVFKNTLCAIVQTSPDIWVLGCLFGVVMGCYYFSKILFQAIRKWSSYAVSEYLFASTMALGILILYLSHPSNAPMYVLIILIISHITGSFPAIARIRHSFIWPNYIYVYRIATYGTGLFLSFGLSLVAMQLDKFLLNYYSNAHILGHYQAYYVSTYSLLSSFSIVFNNYLLPMYGNRRKHEIQNILSRFLFASTLPLWVGSLIAGRLAFSILGGSFAFSWSVLLWASAFNVAIFWLQVQVFFAMTLGQKQLFFNGLGYVVFILVQVMTMPNLIRSHGVLGAFQGMTAASLAGFGVVYLAVTASLKQGKARTDGI